MPKKECIQQSSLIQTDFLDKVDQPVYNSKGGFTLRTRVTRIQPAEFDGEEDEQPRETKFANQAFYSRQLPLC